MKKNNIDDKFKSRFWGLVEKESPDGCWIWKGKHRDKRARFSNKKISTDNAHKIAYILVKNEEMPLCFKRFCDKELCVNPSHLRDRRSLNILLKRMDNYTLKQENGCWIWQGPKEPTGYGLIFFNGKRHKAHRLSYELNKNKIEEGMYICHTCDNPSCINPEHLFEGTPADNVKDMMDKKRHNSFKITHCPEGHPYSKENSYNYTKRKNNRMCKICLKEEKYMKRQLKYQILENLHLLSPSDVAKIPVVSELIDVLKNIKKQFQEYHHESCPWNDFDLAYEESEECNCGTQAKFIKIDSILSIFEPKNQEAE